MDFGLKDKVVLVTGASGVIGKATAVAFAAEGAAVAVAYHADEKRAKATLAEVNALGARGCTVQLDLSDETSISESVDVVGSRLGDPSVLVNNAVEWPGFPQAGDLFETTPSEKMRRSLKVNLEGPYLLSREVVSRMRKSRWGRIVHVSTGLVVDGNVGGAPYVAAKSGLHGLTRVMSRELAPAGILTNVVMAGFVPAGRIPRERTDPIAEAAATRRVTEPQEVAKAIVFLCSGGNTNITGELIRVDGHFLTPA